MDSSLYNVLVDPSGCTKVAAIEVCWTPIALPVILLEEVSGISRENLGCSEALNCFFSAESFTLVSFMIVSGAVVKLVIEGAVKMDFKKAMILERIPVVGWVRTSESKVTSLTPFTSVIQDVM